MWLECTRSCWILQTTLFIFATIPSRAGDLPRGRCEPRNGWLGKRVFLILRIFGERHKKPSFARLGGRGRPPLRGSCHFREDPGFAHTLIRVIFISCNSVAAVRL